MAAGTWSPWQAIRNMDDLQVGLVDLPEEAGGAILARRGERSVVLIDKNLSRVERTAALAHELVHLERGGPGRCHHPSRSWEAVVLREELIIDREVAARLAPIEALARLVTRYDRLGEAVTVNTVAAELDISVGVARIALERVTTIRSGRPAAHPPGRLTAPASTGPLPSPRASPCCDG